MTLARKWLPITTRLAAAAAILALGLAGTDAGAGTNMAFRHRKAIHPLGTGAKGKNYTSLPDRSPYEGNNGLNRLCDHLNLSSNGTIIQIDAQAGLVKTFVCGQLQTFALQPQVGIIVTDTAGTDGMIVGSDFEGQSFTFFDLGSPPLGRNIFPVEYHGTAVTPEDLCVQCGLSSTATITRFDALAGNVQTHVCGGLPLFNLVQGESVLILEDNGPKVCTPGHY
jgi:hypothetical protein